MWGTTNFVRTEEQMNNVNTLWKMAEILVNVFLLQYTKYFICINPGIDIVYNNILSIILTKKISSYCNCKKLIISQF